MSTTPSEQAAGPATLAAPPEAKTEDQQTQAKDMTNERKGSQEAENKEATGNHEEPSTAIEEVQTSR